MGQTKRLKFFIIDDDPFFIELMTQILADAGHSVSSNNAAVFALSEIRSQRPDCILVDLQMAEMDGLALCAELRKMPEIKKSKIIFVSAHKAETWKQRASEAGADGYLTKPIDAVSFVQDIADILEGANES